MELPKYDYKDPQFIIASLMTVVNAVAAIIVYRGLASREEAELWIELVKALIVPLSMVLSAWVARAYIRASTELRLAGLR